MRGIRSGLLVLLLAMLMMSPARAVDVIDVSPLQPVPQQMLTTTLHFNAGERLEAVRTYRYGTSIQVYVILNDVVVPGQPTAPERTQTFDLARFPAGQYQLDIYAGGGGYNRLLLSAPLGVAAPAGLPAVSLTALLLLVLTTVLIGVAARKRMA